jgi:hypothetical protein
MSPLRETLDEYLARISQQTLCIGAANQRKMFCDKLLRDLQELPDADRV